jgi:hypothetical protein
MRASFTGSTQGPGALASRLGRVGSVGALADAEADADGRASPNGFAGNVTGSASLALALALVEAATTTEGAGAAEPLVASVRVGHETATDDGAAA